MSEFFLVRRVLLAALLSTILILFTGIGGIEQVMGLTVFSIFWSFVWQYFVLHFVLKPMQPQARVWTLLGWLVISAGAMVIGLILLENLDWNQSSTDVIKEFAWRSSVYVIGVGMWVGGSCTRRAFETHGGLKSPTKN